MNTKKKEIDVYSLKVDTVKKDIKNIHLGVYPPDGRVRVAAPNKTTDDSIRLLVSSKIPWIKKQRKKFEKQERQSKREYVSGESHYFLGNRYLLNVIETDSKPRIELKRKTRIDLYIQPHLKIEQRAKVFDEFYREELKKNIPQVLKKIQKKIMVEVSDIRIKKMKTKWGTCNPKAKRIWLNLELAKKPIHCLEYVLIHEIVHLTEKNHTDKFFYLMKSILPQWELYKAELNSGILGYSSWN
ncbi:M48 family metallopeptidase [Candidatus Woesearchaeota archaeon]|nr:M48 family metallopeptidase [Candidatus Woesearchaeota archaeon]